MTSFSFFLLSLSPLLSSRSPPQCAPSIRTRFWLWGSRRSSCGRPTSHQWRRLYSPLWKWVMSAQALFFTCSNMHSRPFRTTHAHYSDENQEPVPNCPVYRSCTSVRLSMPECFSWEFHVAEMCASWPQALHLHCWKHSRGSHGRRGTSGANLWFHFTKRYNNSAICDVCKTFQCGWKHQQYV